GAIEAEAREVMRACAAAPPAAPPPMALPVQCRVQAQSSALADLFAILPGVGRADAVTISFTSGTVQDAVRTLNSLSAMSAFLR
ncbi:MAG: M55 family metallopeptidase, partial [Rhodoferax sp.]